VISESGHPDRITGYGSGYWFWLASLALAVVGAIQLPERELTD
jgi:hypothetical protein